MNNLEKALRYLSFGDQDELSIENKANKYDTIYQCITDEEVANKYAQKYDRLVNLLCN